MLQELQFDDFILAISTSVNTDVLHNKTTILCFELSMYGKELIRLFVSTPIESIDDLQKTFDYVIVSLGIEFCRIDQLNKYYDYYAPHVKEILSNYCIRENSDENIKDVNLLYIRSKFLENT